VKRSYRQDWCYEKTHTPRKWCYYLMVISALSIGISPVMKNAAFSQDQSPNSFKYFPDEKDGSQLQLGRGFIQNDLSRTFGLVCLDYVKEPGLSGQGADNISIKTFVTSSYTSLLDVFGLDVNASYHKLGTSIDAKFQENRRLTANSRNVTIVVEAHADYAPVTINPNLKKDYKEMLAKGEVTQFIDTCGARFPFREKLGVRLYAAVTIVEGSSELKEETNASITGSFGHGPISAGARAAFNKELQTAQKSNRVEVSVFARGGDADVVFEGIVKQAIKEKVTLDEIGNALGDFAKTLKREKAATLGFDVADMPGLTAALHDPWSQEKQNRLGRIVALYHELKDKRDILEGITQGIDPRHALYSTEEKDAFRTNISLLDSALTKLIKIHTSCKSVKAPQLEACELQRGEYQQVIDIQTPKPSYPPRGEFAVAVQENPVGNAAQVGQWTLLDAIDSESVFKSPVSNNQAGKPSFDTLQEYFDRHLYRARSVKPSTKRSALVYLLDAEYLDSLEIFISSGAQFRESFQNQRVSIKAWGFGDLNNPELQPASLFSSGSLKGRETSKSLVLNASEVGAKKRIIRAAAVSAQSKGQAKVASLASAPIHSSLLRTVREWIADGRASTGTGQIRLGARDRFAGMSELTFMVFSWDYDETLDIARVSYQFTTGEPGDVAYLTNVRHKDVQFPRVRVIHSWKQRITLNQQAETKYPNVSDKWKALNIKLCKAEVRLDDSSVNLHTGVLRVYVQNTSSGTTVTAKWPHNPNVIGYAGVSEEFPFTVKIDYLVETDTFRRADDGNVLSTAEGCSESSGIAVSR
jgi:hypothetical protein